MKTVYIVKMSSRVVNKKVRGLTIQVICPGFKNGFACFDMFCGTKSWMDALILLCEEQRRSCYYITLDFDPQFDATFQKDILGFSSKEVLDLVKHLDVPLEIVWFSPDCSKYSKACTRLSPEARKEAIKHSNRVSFAGCQICYDLGLAFPDANVMIENPSSDPKNSLWKQDFMQPWVPYLHIVSQCMFGRHFKGKPLRLNRGIVIFHPISPLPICEMGPRKRFSCGAYKRHANFNNMRWKERIVIAQKLLEHLGRSGFALSGKRARIPKLTHPDDFLTPTEEGRSSEQVTTARNGRVQKRVKRKVNPEERIKKIQEKLHEFRALSITNPRLRRAFIQKLRS